MSEATTWSEAASATYRALAAVAVPRRDEQIAALLALAPARPDEPFAVLELACGEGLLGQALLTAFPRATYLGLDGSPSMLAATAARLAPFGARARTAAFELADPAWLPQAEGVRYVVSSLCVHHLDGPGKRQLFGELQARLDPAGALMLADLVAPQRRAAASLYADAWEARVAAASQALTGSDRLLHRFRAESWNHYRTPDPVDRPSPLLDQLLWLREAGFATVDCFWLDAGHAVYGGYRSPPEEAPMPEPGAYDRALAIARAVLAG